MNKQYTLWCTYHDKIILNEYNLYENNNYHLFYDNDFTLKEDNINYLHDYLGDIVTYYYVWKNNIKSDIIGFDQYRRHFIDINYDIIKQRGYYNYYGTFMNKTLYHEMNYLMSDHYINCFITYMKQKYNKNLISCMSEYHYMSWHNMYFFDWNTFCNVCDFIFGFFDYLLPNNQWKDPENLIILSKINSLKNEQNYINNTYDTLEYWNRFLSVMSEDLIGIYLTYIHGDNIINSEKYYKYIICNDLINDIEHLKKWWKLNIKTGIRNFIIKSNINNLENFIFKDSNIYLYNDKLTYNNLITKFNNLEAIQLHSNEYIDCDNGIEFHNGKYNIKVI